MYKNTQNWYLSTPPNPESCLSSSKVIGFAHKKFSKTKTVVAQKIRPMVQSSDNIHFQNKNSIYKGSDFLSQIKAGNRHNQSTRETTQTKT